MCGLNAADAAIDGVLCRLRDLPSPPRRIDRGDRPCSHGHRPHRSALREQGEGKEATGRSPRVRRSAAPQVEPGGAGG